jgi:hypothetical protein
MSNQEILEEIKKNNGEILKSRDELLGEIKRIDNSIAEVIQSHNVMSQRFDEICEKFNEISQRFNELNNKMENQDRVLKQVLAEVDVWKNYTNTLEQKLLANFLIINGIEKDKEIDCNEIFVNICHHLNIQIDNDKVLETRRMKNGAICVELIHRKFRDMIMEAKKKKTIYAHEILGGPATTKKFIFVNEMLTAKSAAIFKKARELKAKGCLD